MKHTGGGTFNPANRHIYFGAGNGDAAYTASFPPNTLVALSDLMTNTRELDERLAVGQNIMLDSGIFTLTMEHRRNTGITMDEALSLAPDEIPGFDKLFTRYLEVVKKYEDRLWGYVELDQGGMTNKIKTRERLEAHGLRPMPVYHPFNDGWDYFDQLAGDYDRICCGNIVWAAPSLRSKIAATIWERHRDHPDLWIHGLGYSPNEVLHSYPFDSVDSTTWFSPVRWGLVRKQITVDIEPFADLTDDYLYIRGIPGHRENAISMATWTVLSMTHAWHTHRDELAQLGVPHMPPRTPTEAAPCPSA